MGALEIGLLTTLVVVVVGGFLVAIRARSRELETFAGHWSDLLRHEQDRTEEWTIRYDELLEELLEVRVRYDEREKELLELVMTLRRHGERAGPEAFDEKWERSTIAEGDERAMDEEEKAIQKGDDILAEQIKQSLLD